MSRPLMSAAAGALLRALLNRAGRDGARILLTDLTSVDWHSLTYAGERHLAGFAIGGSDAMALAERWLSGIEDADLPIGKSRFVAEIKVTEAPEVQEDGTVFLRIEALTLDS